MAGSRGRPQVRLQLNPGFTHVVGGRITVAEISVVVADYAGVVVATRTTDITGVQHNEASLVEAVATEIIGALSGLALTTDNIKTG